MATEHTHSRGSNLDILALAEDLKTRLGRSVSVVFRGAQEGDDGPVEGLLRIQDPNTGDPLDVDGRTVSAALQAAPDLPTQEEIEAAEAAAKKAEDDAKASKEAARISSLTGIADALTAADDWPSAKQPLLDLLTLLQED